MRTIAILRFFFAVLCGLAIHGTVFSQNCSPNKYDSRGLVPKNDRNWIVTHERQQSMLAENPPDFIVVGDSMAARWPLVILKSATNFQDGINLGIGGDLIQNVAWRISGMATELKALKFIVIFVGTNNLSRGDNPCSIIIGLTGIVDRLRAEAPNAKIIVIGIPFRGTDFSFKKINIIDVNTQLEQLKGLGIDVIDPNAIFQRSATPVLLPDSLHINENGYKMLSDEIAVKFGNGRL